MKTLLIVEDDIAVAAALAELLTDNYVVHVAHDGVEALAIVESKSVDVILLDFMLPVMNGDVFLHALRSRGLATPVILASASAEIRETAKNLEVQGVLAKPFDISDLERTLQRILSDPSGPSGGGSAMVPPEILAHPSSNKNNSASSTQGWKSPVVRPNSELNLPVAAWYGEQP